MTEALELAARGWRVLPLHSVDGDGCTCGKPRCDSPGKHPRINDWQHEANTDPDVINNWCEQWPGTNAGIQTGSASGFVVLDVDPRNGGDDSLHEMEQENGGLPRTVEVETGGGGRHIYFLDPGGLSNSKSEVGAGLDIKADNGYVVAPPSMHTSGRRYEWEVDHHPDNVAIAEMPAWLLALCKKKKIREPAPLIDDVIPDGEKHGTFVSLAGTMRSRGMSGEEIAAALKVANRNRSESPAPDENIEAIAHDISGRYPPAPEHPTDLGNARRLVAQHGKVLLFDHGRNKWLSWDGMRWKVDATAEVKRKAKQTVASIYAEAELAKSADDRKALAKHAIASESDARIRAMIALAESEPGIPVLPDELDANRWLFNCENGAVDLRSGDLRPHNQDDRITKLAPVEYNPDVSSDLWDKFLHRITGGDSELSGFLQRAAGYTLTGDTGEEVLFFPFGPEATGKSTFTEAMKSYMGSYAMTADFESFLARRGDAGIRNDIARLAGARLVLSLEVDDGKKLAEGLLKQVTGGDTISARFLHKEFFEFVPAFKLWLAANHRPKVRADDGAMWRRIVQIPFTEIIPEAERDPELKRRLKHDPSERAAILAWAVRGCLDWQEGGLRIPERVRDFTAEYRAENDPLREWLSTCCELKPGAVTSAKDLRASYTSWADENGEPSVSNNRMAVALRAHGCEPDRTKRLRTWVGVGFVGE